MKIKLSFFLFLLLGLCLFWSSCQRKAHNRLLLQIAERIETEPREALKMLDSVRNKISSFPTREQMYYSVLRMWAMDLCNKPLLEDSAMYAVVSYYEDEGIPDEKANAYYYMGGVCRDMKDAPQALDYYMKALSLCDRCMNKGLEPRILTQMGLIYLRQGYYDEAMGVFRQAVGATVKNKDKRGYAFSLREVGKTFYHMQQYDSAVAYYEKAYRTVADDKKLRAQAMELKEEKESLSLAIGNHILPARTGAVKSLSSNLPLWNLLQGEFLVKADRKTLARVCFEQALNTGNNYIRQEAALNLSRLDESAGNYKDALDKYRLHVQLNDSIQSVNDKRQIRQLNALYNYQLRAKENARLEEANSKQQTVLIVMVAIMWGGLFLGLFFWQYNSYKRHRREVDRRMQEEARQELYRRSLQRLEDNKVHIQELEKLLQDVHIENDAFQQELLEMRKRKLEMENEQITVFHEENQLLMDRWTQSEMYKRIQYLLKEGRPLSSEEKERLCLLMDEIFDGFAARLLQSCTRITSNELLICYLIKIQLRPIEISILLSCTKQAVTMARTRLYEKIFGVKGSTDQLDEYVLSL